MGYGYYTLPDGRDAGYLVSATCDKDDCYHSIDRGLSYLCGEEPNGSRTADEYGCGNYYCDDHQLDHDCPKPACGEYSADGDKYCERPEGHDLPHRDPYDGDFIETETDLEKDLEKDIMSDPTPETPEVSTIESLLQAAITDKLPVDPTPEEIRETVSAAAAILLGAGYRRVRFMEEFNV